MAWLERHHAVAGRSTITQCLTNNCTCKTALISFACHVAAHSVLLLCPMPCADPTGAQSPQFYRHEPVWHQLKVLLNMQDVQTLQWHSRQPHCGTG